MKRIICFSVIVLFLLSAMSSAELSFIIEDNGVDEMKVGDSIGSVYAKYSKNQIKLANLQHYAEGQFCPGLEIYLEDAEKPALEIILGWNNGWIIDDIYVNDSRFKTAEGIGPSSTAADLKKVYEIIYADFYEGGLYIKTKEFDGLFVSWSGGFTMELIDDPTAIELIPDDLKMEQVRIVNQRR